MNKDLLWIYTNNTFNKNWIHYKNLVKDAKILKLKSLAYLNCDSLDFVKHFYDCAKDFKIKAIIGIMIYVLPSKEWLREVKMDGKETQHHIRLIALNNTGVENLICLASLSSLDNYFNRPSVTKKCLNLHKEGLIASSGSASGAICHHILNDQYEEAFKIAKEYADVFEEGCFYIELQLGNEQLNESLMNIAKKLKLPLIAFNQFEKIIKLDNWVDPSDFFSGNNFFLKEFEKKRRCLLKENYLKIFNKIKIEFRDAMEVFSNTQKIIQKIDFTYEEQRCYPLFKETEGLSDSEFLEKIAMARLASQKEIAGQQYFIKLKKEINSVIERGLASYFLIVWDLFKFVNQKGFAVTHHYDLWPEQILLFALGVTSIETLALDEFADNLSFIKPPFLPKIEVEINSEQKQELIEYILFKYGAEDLIQNQANTKKMTASEILSDFAVNQDIQPDTVDSIAKFINENTHDSLFQTFKNNIELLKKCKADQNIKKVYLMARDIEYAKTKCIFIKERNTIFLASKPILTITPLLKTEFGIKLQSSRDMLDKWGFLEIRINKESLPLRLINKIIAHLNINRQMQLTMSQIPLDDDKTFSTLLDSNFTGLGREEYLDKNIYMRLKPKTIQEIIDAFNLSQPWNEKKHLEFYLGVKSGKIKIQTEHPIVTAALTSTCGLLLYTEQAEEIAYQMSGFSAQEVHEMDDFDNYQKPGWVARNQEKFINQAQNNGVPKDIARKTYNRLLRSCLLSFALEKKNAILFYLTAYLKSHFPEDYMKILINENIDNAEKVEEYILECERLNIK